MKILIFFLVIIIIILLFSNILIFKNNKRLLKKIYNLNNDNNLITIESINLKNKYKILDDELNFLKKIEKEQMNDQYIRLDNVKIKKKSTFNGKKVLIGDYNSDMLKHTRNIFLSLGFDVDVVYSGENIIQKILCGNNYDVIVTNNIYKNGCDGEDVMNELREIENFSTPIVVLTVSVGLRKKFIDEIKFDGYLEKMLTQQQAEEEMTRLLLKRKSD